jgi:hypothetical protein
MSPYWILIGPVRTAARRRIARPLISSLEAAMHCKAWHVDAILTEAEVLRDSSTNTWSAGEKGKRDDIVLAVRYGIWWTTSGPRVHREGLPI